MPMKSKNPAAQAKKRRAGFKKRKYRTVNITRSALNPIPQSMIAKHKYTDVIGVPLNGSSLAFQNFRLNSTYDPDFTRSVSGHQPYGRDTYASLYNRYRVIGCGYNVSIVSSSAAGAIQVCAIPSNEDLTGSLTNISAAREQPRARYMLQAGAGNGAPIRNLKGYVSIPSLMGLTKTQYMANENAQAQNNANPTEAAILNLVVGSYAETTSTDTIYMNVELTYVCEWFDPIILGQS